jgi:CheY-like chemotaxis protein
MEDTVTRHAKVGLVDDSPEFLELMRYHLMGNGVEVAATGSPDESIAWVTAGEIDILIADMRMPEHGLQLAERVQRLSTDIEVVMLTGFIPTEEERQWARKLGLVIYSKTEQDDLVQYVAEASSSPQAHETRELKRRIRILEYVHEQWTNDLVSKLERIPDLNAVISSADGGFTISELIDDIRRLTPRGIRYIETWHRVLDTLLKMGKRK